MDHVDLHTFYHIGVEAAITSAYVLFVKEPKLPDYLFIAGFAMGVGFMKECYDQSVGGKFDNYDIAADAVGVGLGAITFGLRKRF